MTTTIYFIRHGAVHNPQDILYGRLPGFHLSIKGSGEIAQTAQFLKDKNIYALYASPLLRAKESAHIIQGQLKLPNIHINKQILEVKTAYQGKLFSELDPLQFWVYSKPLSETDETMEQVGERMMSFVSETVQKHPGETIAVCSHGDPIMILIALINKKPMNLPSVKGGVYSKHGEVFKLTDEDGKQNMKSVFIPQRAK
ncbi:MAG: histidine phosphatase family protein [Candidatus Levyibacteriota bacterium]